MDAWQSILKTALLGTGRGASALPAIPGAIGLAVGAACTSTDASDNFLRAAAILGTARLAGFSPAAQAPSVPPAPAETVPFCSAAAGACLARMLLGEFRDVLAEFLEAVASAKRLVPHHHLPELLALAARDRDLRARVRRVIGVRGDWLMQQNAEWQFDTLEEDGAVWETGTRELRIAAFRRMRQADPAGTLQRLVLSWQQEAPEDRSALVECLGTNLSMADEPFLESALDDRRKEVRKAAAELLMRLPSSRLVERMTARLRSLIRVGVAEKRKLLGLGSVQQVIRIEVSIPEACDKAMIRDGVEAKAPSGKGEKAWWLEQVIAAVPPAVLASEAGVAADRLIEAADGTDWAGSLLRGWAIAAARHRDGHWAGAVLPWHMRRAAKADSVEIIELLAEAIVPAEREAAAIRMVAQGHMGLISPVGRALLLGCKPCWSAELSRAVIEAIRRLPQNDLSWLYPFRELIVPFGLRLDLAMVNEVSQLVVPGGEAWGKAVAALAELVQFRHDMQKSIKES